MDETGPDGLTTTQAVVRDTPWRSHLLDRLPDAVVVLDRELRVLWGNAAAAKLVDARLDDWLGRSAAELIHPDDLEFALLSVTSVQDKVVGTPIELRIRGASGWSLAELVGSPLHGPAEVADPTAPDAGAIVLCIRDLTERRRWEVAGDETAMFRSLVQHAAALTMLVSGRGAVVAASAAIVRDLGHDPEAVVGRPLLALVHPGDAAALLDALDDARNRPPGSPVCVEVRLRRGGGHVPYELTLTNLLDDPTVSGLVVSGHDITRLRAAQAALEQLARCDPLTQLPNRTLLDQRLTEGLERLRRTGAPLVVAFVDLDRFKPINDLFGHDAGDELLRAVAQRLRHVAGDATVARFGGDEFVVVAAAPAAEGPALVRRIEEAVAEPFALRGGTVQIFASAGYAVAHAAHTPESLLAEADSRMYAVKRGRRGHPALAVTSVAERRRTAEDLADALVSGQVRPHYQPIVSLGDEQVVSYEALVRWQHPDRGLLLPDAFLGVAEDSGRELELGELVLRSACRHLARLSATGHPQLTLAVNASAGQLAEGSFADLVLSVLEEHGLAPGRLCVEITERSVLERAAQGPSVPIRRTLEELSGAGVRLAIDDFGTGYSSLSHVLDFPVDVLKIDRSFVGRLATHRQSRAVVAAVVQLADGMGFTAIAEGVETPDQARLLRDLGCPLAQGFLFGRPQPG